MQHRLAGQAYIILLLSFLYFSQITLGRLIIIIIIIIIVVVVVVIII